jgi:hypothetical protein
LKAVSKRIESLGGMGPADQPAGCFFEPFFEEDLVLLLPDEVGIAPFLL